MHARPNHAGVADKAAITALVTVVDAVPGQRYCPTKPAEIACFPLSVRRHPGSNFSAIDLRSRYPKQPQKLQPALNLSF